MDVGERRIDGERQGAEAVEDFIETDDVLAVGELAVERQRLESLGEFADVLGVVEGLDVAARAGDGDAVQQFEKIEVERVENGGGGALFGRQGGPRIEGGLGAAENFVDVLFRTEFRLELVRLAFVSEGELVAEIGETVVHRGGGKHEDFRFHAGSNDLVHQPRVAGFAFFLAGVVVAEIVRLIDDDEVVISPVHPVERHTERLAAGAEEVGVAEDVVVETILGEEVGDEVAVVVQPVVREFFRAEDEDGFITQLVVFDDGEGGEGFAEAHAVGEDAAIVGFQLVDDAGGGIALEVEQLLPNQCFEVARAVVGQHVFVQVFQELVEDVVEHQKVDALGRIFLVARCNVLAYQAGYVFELVGVGPNLIEQTQEHASVSGLVKLVDDVGYRIAVLVAQIDGCEAMQRHVNRIGHCA